MDEKIQYINKWGWNNWLSDIQENEFQSLLHSIYKWIPDWMQILNVKIYRKSINMSKAKIS